MSEEQAAEATAETAEATEAGERVRVYRNTERGQRRNLIGVVTGTKMNKTIIVSIERVEQHHKYHKYIRRHSKVYAHDETEAAKVGDKVKLVECRPRSKLKRFALVTVLDDRVTAETGVAVVFADREYIEPKVREFVDRAVPALEAALGL